MLVGHDPAAVVLAQSHGQSKAVLGVLSKLLLGSAAQHRVGERDITPTRSYSCRTTSTPTSQSSLYEAFPAAEARRLVARFEWHYTPKHGSWLDMA